MSHDKKILKRKPYSDRRGDEHLEVVLCEVEFGSHPYVTWIHNKESGGFVHGNYFTTLHEANDDFEVRAQRAMKSQDNFIAGIGEFLKKGAQ